MKHPSVYQVCSTSKLVDLKTDLKTCEGKRDFDDEPMRNPLNNWAGEAAA
jgi:hypothetical protein